MLQYRRVKPTECEEFPNGGSFANPLVAKLERFVSLGFDEVASIETLSREQRRLAADHLIIKEGSRPDHVCMILHGFAYRFKTLANGRRQILGYLVPGDLCSVHFAVFDRLDHSIAALGDCQVVEIPNAALLDLIDRHPLVERGLALAALVDRSILHEWLLNIGQRNAYQKLSHFFCEMSARLEAIGHVNGDGSLDLPLNQAALADTTGLTPVHINRTLQRMRGEGLIALRGRRLTIQDQQRLAAIAGFEKDYLTLQVPVGGG